MLTTNSPHTQQPQPTDPPTDELTAWQKLGEHAFEELAEIAHLSSSPLVKHRAQRLMNQIDHLLITTRTVPCPE